MKADKLASERAVLTDITNSRLPRPTPTQQEFSHTPSKSHVEKLLQVNVELNMQKTEHDNKVKAIEAQNTTLSQELHAVKDELRLLRHELASKNVGLKTRDMEQEEKVQIQTLPLNTPSQEEEVKATKPSCDHIIANKPNTNSRRQNQQARSLGAPSTREEEVEKFKVQKKRFSGKFHKRVLDHEENLLEIEEAKYPITQPVKMPKPDQKLQMTCSSPSKEGEESNNCSASGKEAAKRSSMARPPRREAEKVQSYKEISLKKKMRRME